MLHGPLPEQWAKVADAPHLWRKAPFILLLAGLLVFGCFPRLLTDKIQPSVSEKVMTAFTPLASPSTPLTTEFRPAAAPQGQLEPVPSPSVAKAAENPNR